MISYDLFFLDFPMIEVLAIFYNLGCTLMKDDYEGKCVK